jgi:isomerase DpgB
VSSIADLADVYFEMSGGEPLSAALVSGVVDVCARVEDASAKRPTLVVRIEGVNHAGGTEPWPHESGTHAIHLVTQWERTLRRVERLPAVVVAVVGAGVCRGPAFDLLLATDYRIATGDLRLELAGADGAVWPGMALYRLASQLGVAAARRLVVSRESLTALRAMEVGIIDEFALDGDGTASRIPDVIESLVGVGGKEFAIRRQLIIEAASSSFDEALGPHLAACDRALRLARQGMDAASVPDTRL